MRWALLVMLAAPLAAAQPLLVAVVPDLPGSGVGEEAVALGSGTDFDVGGYQIVDGEDTFVIPEGTHLAAGVPAWFVANATLWSSFQGPAPIDSSFDLRLGNDGDEVRLLDAHGALVDAFAFGGGATAGTDGPIRYTSPGLVYQRLAGVEGWLDTDQVSDWQTPRPHRIGESNLDAPNFAVSHLTLYASPDSSFETLTDLVALARQRLHLHVYELRSMALVDAIVAAKQAHPSLDLQVMVDASPVGVDAGERHASADALRRIQAAGGDVWLAGHGRYDYHHLKVLVVDQGVAIQSENWVPSGVPEDPSWGNRGWGVVVHDPAASDWFASWMAADRAAWDTKEFELGVFDPDFQAPLRFAARSGTYRPVASLELHGAFTVRPVIAPDHTQDPTRDPLILLAGSAQRRLDVQQLDASLEGRNALGWHGDDGLAQALVAAHQNGASVRVQVAEPFAADDVGNRETLAWLLQRGIPGRESADGQFSTLHNKGQVADDAVVVGSINGNHHSRSENREVAVILEGAGIAPYFGALFDADWRGADPGRDWSVPGRDLHALPMTPLPTLLALLGLAWALRSRT